MTDLNTLLHTIPAEYLDADLVTAGIAQVAADGNSVELVYPYPGNSVGTRAAAAIAKALAAAGRPPVHVATRTTIARRVAQGGAERVNGVRNILAVASAKGGVGKSMVAANLALALSAEGARTGLLDADIYGPSQPVLLGGAKARANEQGLLLPHELHGLQTLSMGHLIDAGQAIIWRGPMVIRALRQLLRETAWHNLDFLVLDLPPGTGDVQLSIAQTVPVAGAIIVTTPQALAVADAERGVNMFEKVSIPVLGYIANMANYVCPSCGAEHEIFGSADSGELAVRLGTQELARLPLDPLLGAASTAGTPAFLAAPNGPLALHFRDLAARVGAKLTTKAVDRGASLPKVVSSQ